MKLSEDDLYLVKFTQTQINNINVELKTLNGFLAQYIQSKYLITDQSMFDKLLKGEEVLVPVFDNPLPPAGSLELVKE